ncbi:MAG: four helix bundle protein [Bacteroidaceae bacterium]|nr:four helix bundle protein [Bacteroidaceae bacterium]
MNSMEVFGYRNLIAYQKAKDIIKRTYKLLKKFPAEERYAMCDQLRRASVSVTSNIAEGVNRYSVKDKAHFIEMAFGSLMEVSSQIEIAEELGYITSDDRMSMDELIKEEARLLSGLQNSYKPSTDSTDFKL